MSEQNFKNHRRVVPGYHYVLSLLLLVGIGGSIYNLVSKWSGGLLLEPLLIMLAFICICFLAWFVRTFPMKAQDRAIRAEEQLRYFILTRKPLDSRLTIGQVAALRFAPDDELLPLADRAVAEQLSPDDIKKAIKNWRADEHRV